MICFVLLPSYKFFFFGRERILSPLDIPTVRLIMIIGTQVQYSNR